MKRIAISGIALVLAVGLFGAIQARATVGPGQMGQLKTTIDSNGSLVQ